MSVVAARWRFGGLFRRLFLSYFVSTLATALFATYIARFNGPFVAFRGTPLVTWFAHFGSNEANSGVLFVVLATIVGTLTGLLVTSNLTRRLRRIALAADAWSHGDFAATTRDASHDELGQLARDLDRMAEQVQTLLATRQELAVVEERNRLARELHDSVKQHIFANALLVRAARKVFGRDQQMALGYLEEAESLAARAQEELVALIRALRPAALADRGLVAVLRDEAADWSRRTRIATEVRVSGERSTPLEVEDALFRVAQEALTNVARHSDARHVEVRVTWDAGHVTMEVADDGSGFDPARAEGKGLGLASMRERIAELRGALTISSAPGGTCVEACVPVIPTSPSPREPAEVAHE